jgi:hypothetical protein
MGQQTISAFVPVAQHSTTADLPDAEEASCGRAERAMTEDMDVTAEIENGAATGLYEVESESGSQYTVDAEEGRCSCPDHQHRNAQCKHLRRVALAITYTNLAAPDVVVPGAEEDGEDSEEDGEDDEDKEVPVRLHNGMRVVPGENQHVNRFGVLVEEDEDDEADDEFDMEEYKRELDAGIADVISGMTAGA